MEDAFRRLAGDAVRSLELLKSFGIVWAICSIGVTFSINIIEVYSELSQHFHILSHHATIQL